MKMKPIKSDFAILDVLKGFRHKLAEHFDKAPRLGRVPDELRIPVVIVGHIDRQHGSDDGTSIQFTVEVADVIHGQPGDSIQWEATAPNGVRVTIIRNGESK